MKEVENLENADEILEIPMTYGEQLKAVGREEERKDVALEMLKEGASIEFIAKVTKLSEKQVEQLKSQL